MSAQIKHMRASPFHRGLITAVVLCAIAFLLGRFSNRFEGRWRDLKNGMTQAEVMQALGSPTSTGRTPTIGAGNQPVTRWEYRRGLRTYCVDFDYIGPGGAPLVFRTEIDKEEWDWTIWFPPARAKTRS